MQFEERLELIRRNTVETITEEELVNVLKTKERPIVYCGYEPNGPVHLGHFVTIIKLMDFYRAGFKVKVLLADMHAFLNRKGNEEEINRDVQIWRRTVEAIGLNAEVILGSSFEFEKEYQLEVMRLARGCTINRALRSMQEIARDITHATLSQTWYPLMQVVDIKFLGVDVAEGGLEQRKIHMMGRDTVEITRHPFVAIHTPLISSLKGPGEKMSKSIPDSGISVTDTFEDIQRVLKNAYCPERVVKENPILEIVRLIVFPKMNEINVERPMKFGGDILYSSYSELQKDFASGTLHPLDLKMAVARVLEKIIKPIRDKAAKMPIPQS
jgi:tyrosyl-tRNA synthetase